MKDLGTIRIKREGHNIPNKGEVLMKGKAVDGVVGYVLGTGRVIFRYF